MQLLAIQNNDEFFRGQSVTNDTIEMTKQAMLKDQENLEFRIIPDEEFESWLLTH